MKGLVVTGDGTLRLVDDIPVPVAQNYTAVVKTIACGICNGTDLKLVDGHLNGYHSYPAVLGHEAAGRVVECGENVRYFKKGDLVLRSGLDDMGPQYASLWGSFAEFGRVVDCRAMQEDGLQIDEGLITQQVVPGGIDPVDATMLITIKEIYAALGRLGIKRGDRVAIAGCGPVGQVMVQLCRLMGASFAALSGHHESRLETARKLGADLTVNSRKDDFGQMIRAQCQQPLDYYIDAVGRCNLVSEALTLIKEDGIIGVYGIGMEEDRGIRWGTGPYNFRIHSVQWPIPRTEYQAHDQVMQWVLEGKIRLSDYVTHRLPLEQYEAGFDLVKKRQGLKIALCFES